MFISAGQVHIWPLNFKIHPPCFHLGKDKIDDDAVTKIEAEEPHRQNL